MIQFINIILILRRRGHDIVAVKTVSWIGAAGKIAHRRGPLTGLSGRAVKRLI